MAISYVLGGKVSKGRATGDVGANQTVPLKYQAPLIQTWDAKVRPREV